MSKRERLEHARFMAAGWKQLAKEIDATEGQSYDTGWKNARDLYTRQEGTLRTYLTRALAECDPKTRKAIEADLAAEGVEL